MIKHFDGDRTELDCVLVPRISDPAQSLPKQKRAASRRTCLLSNARSSSPRDAYVKANQAAQTQEERDLASDLFPGKFLIDRCMVIEAKHRGSRTAIGAMHWIMRMAAMNSNNPSTPARDRLIMVLRDHYVANADLDLLIDEFPHGDTPLEAEGLLGKSRPRARTTTFEPPRFSN